MKDIFELKVSPAQRVYPKNLEAVWKLLPTDAKAKTAAYFKNVPNVDQDNNFSDTLDSWEGSGNVIPQVSHLNSSKKRLATAVKLNVFLESFGSLWKAACKRLQKELNKGSVKVDFQVLNPLKVSTSSMSASKNKSCRHSRFGSLILKGSLYFEWRDF